MAYRWFCIRPLTCPLITNDHRFPPPYTNHAISDLNNWKKQKRGEREFSMWTRTSDLPIKTNCILYLSTPLYVPVLLGLVRFRCIFLFCVKTDGFLLRRSLLWRFRVCKRRWKHKRSQTQSGGWGMPKAREGGRGKGEKSSSLQTQGEDLPSQFWRKTTSSYSCSYHAWSLLYPLLRCPISSTKMHDQKAWMFRAYFRRNGLKPSPDSDWFNCHRHSNIALKHRQLTYYRHAWWQRAAVHIYGWAGHYYLHFHFSSWTRTRV